MKGEHDVAVKAKIDEIIGQASVNNFRQLNIPMHWYSQIMSDPLDPAKVITSRIVSAEPHYKEQRKQIYEPNGTKGEWVPLKDKEKLEPSPNRFALIEWWRQDDDQSDF